MLISAQHQERLRDALREHPLQAGEVRRVEWAGEQYIARSETMSAHPEAGDYTQLYTLRIDDVLYIVYSRLPKGGA